MKHREIKDIIESFCQLQDVPDKKEWIYLVERVSFFTNQPMTCVALMVWRINRSGFPIPSEQYAKLQELGVLSGEERKAAENNPINRMDVIKTAFYRFPENKDGLRKAAEGFLEVFNRMLKGE